ncbi:MAG: amidohydrolase family protein [Gemmatimonadales bacterium]
MGIKIDCDSHFSPKDAFDEVDPKFYARGPKIVSGASGRSVTVYPERTEQLLPFMWNYPTQFNMGPGQHRGIWDIDTRVNDLGKIGFDKQVLIPQGAPYAYDVPAEMGASVCRSANNAMARAVAKHPDDFLGLAALPMQDIQLAIEELERSVELGLYPNIQTHIQDRNLDEYEFWPFYERVEALNVPLLLHSSHVSITAGAHRYKKYRFGNALQFPMESWTAIGSLICGGVLDTFPKLRVATVEAGAGHLPYLFQRLNEVATEEPQWTKVSINKLPTEYLDQFWFTFNIATEAPLLPSLIEYIGADRLLLTSDYPHGLAGSGANPVEALETLETVSPVDKEKMEGLNAAELFKLEI